MAWHAPNCIASSVDMLWLQSELSLFAQKMLLQMYPRHEWFFLIRYFHSPFFTDDPGKLTAWRISGIHYSRLLRWAVGSSAASTSWAVKFFHNLEAAGLGRHDFGSEALEKQLGIRMICHQFEPIEVLASDQALQWICYITWSRAGGAAAREYVGQESAIFASLNSQPFQPLDIYSIFCMTGWWQTMACDDLFTISPHLWTNPVDNPGPKISPHLIHWTQKKTVSCCALSFPLADSEEEIGISADNAFQVGCPTVGWPQGVDRENSKSTGRDVCRIWVDVADAKSISFNVLQYILMDSPRFSPSSCQPILYFCCSPNESWWLSSEGKTRLLRSDV